MTMKYHFTSTKIALAKSQTIIRVNKVEQEVEQSFTPSKNSFLVTLKNSSVFTKLPNTDSPYDPQFHSEVNMQVRRKHVDQKHVHKRS